MNNSKETTEAFLVQNITNFPSITGDSIHLADKYKDANKEKLLEKSLEETTQPHHLSDQELEILDTSETVSIASDFKSKEPSAHSVTQESCQPDVQPAAPLPQKESLSHSNVENMTQDTHQLFSPEQLAPGGIIGSKEFVVQNVAVEEFTISPPETVQDEVTEMPVIAKDEAEKNLIYIEDDFTTSDMKPIKNIALVGEEVTIPDVGVPNETVEPLIQEEKKTAVIVDNPEKDIVIPSGSTVSLSQEIKDDIQPLPHILLSEETEEQRNRLNSEEEQDQKPKGRFGRLFKCFFFRKRKPKVIHDCGQYH